MTNDAHDDTPLDVTVSIGDARIEVLTSMLSNLTSSTLLPPPNTVAFGTGRYRGMPESSAVLIWTGLPVWQIWNLKRRVRSTLKDHDQEAAGFQVVPTGSALIYSDRREESETNP